MLLNAYAKSANECIRTLARHRRLLIALIKRELSDDYVTHNLSIGWTFIHPLFLMVVYLFLFTKVFVSRVAAPPEAGTDALIYLLSGIIPWLAISQVMSKSAASVVGNSSIVKQMSFPLELLPIKTLAGPFMFSGVSLCFLIVYAMWATGGKILPAYLLGLPPLIIITCIQLAGLALLLGSLQVFFRDLKEFISVFLTIGLFIHPILYFPNAIPAAVRPLIYLSPFSYLLFCWQNVLFFGQVTWIWSWIISAAFAVLYVVVGARVFIVTKSSIWRFLVTTSSPTAQALPVGRSDEVAVCLEDVAKAYKLYDRPFDFLREALTGRPYHRNKVVLSDVSLTLKRGEILGIIGSNGAGKSTLLKIIAGTLAATQGNVRVNGRVAAILELGTGFNPNYSGRDNVILSALMRGMSEETVKRKFDSIVAFAGLENAA